MANAMRAALRLYVATQDGASVPVARQIVTKLLDGRLVFTPRDEPHV